MAVTGTWNIIARTPAGEQKATFVFSDEGGTLTGRMLMGERSLDIFDGKTDGKQIAWKVTVDQPMSRTIEFDGTWSGDAMSGRARAGMFGSSTFKGTRVCPAASEAAGHDPRPSVAASVTALVGSLVRKVVPYR